MIYGINLYKDMCDKLEFGALTIISDILSSSKSSVIGP